MQVRLYSVDEANAAVPQLERAFERVRDLMAKVREVRDQLVDLRIVWGDRVDDETCTDHQEYVDYKARFTELEATLQETFNQFTELGCELKDVENGLVDFHARRGDEIVHLCWKYGEPRILAWHPRAAGYAGRRPIEDF